jgi:GNAT superfamily N-acetyltransferase
MLAALPSRLSRVLARRAGLRLFRLFSRPLSGFPSVENLELRMVRKEEALGLCADLELDLRPGVVAEAYARGDLCVGAFDRVRLAGYCWLAFAPVHHLDGVWVEFGPSAVWTYKALVRPSHRGRGIAAALYRFADAQCRARGRSTSILCIESHNAPSARAAMNAGYAHAGYAAYLRRRDDVRTWTSGGLEPLGVRFYLPRERGPEPVPAG